MGLDLDCLNKAVSLPDLEEEGIKIRNISATVDIEGEFDRAALAEDLPNSEYNPEKHRSLIPHEDLVAHLHVLYGGEESLMACEDLRADWADLLDAPPSKPPQVDVRTLSLDTDEWSVTAVDGKPVTAYGDLRGYHREGFRDLAQLAAMSPRDLYGLADDLANGFRRDEGRSLAGLALPFATGTRLATASPVLQTA